MAKSKSIEQQQSDEIVKLACQLTLAIKDANPSGLERAEETIQRFVDSWLITGEMNDFPVKLGRTACLSDCDVMERVLEAIDIVKENADA